MYVYQPETRIETFEQGVEFLRSSGSHRVIVSGVPHNDAQALDDIASRLPHVRLAVDEADYRRYLSQARYDERFPGYYAGNIAEKSFEHYLAFTLLRPGGDDVFIDVAAEGSPLGTLFSEATGCTSYAQDIMYPAGLHERRIGGDAAAMPVPAGFASLAALTCSIEHFENDADTGTVRELGRVLRRGGRFIVVPLYLWTYPAAQTDPTYSAGVPFDDGVTIHCARGWCNRHGRFYSPETLQTRLLSVPGFAFTVYRLVNTPPGIYARWVLVGERLA